jgi:ligand-binding sensor domain-containing protein
MHLYTNWRTYTTRNGLPSNEAKCIRVYGSRVWVGTDNGLACYEGGRWRTYGVEDGLPHRVVMALDVSAQTGDLWVGTAGGVSRFSGGRFENFNQMNSGLANDLVYGISCYEEDVWIATASGVSRYNTRTREWEIFNNNNTIMFEPWCYAISARDDMVYVGVWGGGVVEYSYRTGYWKDYHDPDGELEICLFRDAGVVHEVIPAVSYENGILWAGSYFGLSTYDGKRWKNYFKKDSGLPSDFINFVRAQGSVGWICTDDGLSSFDGTTWFTYRKAGGGGEVRTHRGANLVEKRRLPTLLSHNYVLGVDFQGENVWVATAQGVCLGKPGPQ